MFRLQIIRKYNLRIKALISSQNIQLQFLNGSEFPRCSNTGKVIFEWCKQVADNRDAPWSAQEPLPRQSAHVGHVRIVDWEAKDPDRKTSKTRNKEEDRQADRRQNGGRHRKITLRWWTLIELWKLVWRMTFRFTYLSISVHQSMSSFSFMYTGKCWSLPCLMELDLVVMVLTLSNWQERERMEQTLRLSSFEGLKNNTTQQNLIFFFFFYYIRSQSD